MGFWPFKRKQEVEQINPESFGFSQVDTTEHFDDNSNLSQDEWIGTVPLNRSLGHDNNGNLPALDASDHEIYRIALHLSEIRETFRIPSDGVYCPVCHIANVDIEKLGKNCPKCERPLLVFGWT